MMVMFPRKKIFLLRSSRNEVHMVFVKSYETPGDLRVKK